MNIQGNAEIMQKQGAVEQPQRDHSTGFDYRVQIKDAKTGRLIRTQHYARHASGTKVLLERPIGSGNAYTENGDPAGRWDFSDPANWKKLSDKHSDVKASAANREEELEQRLQVAELELQALRDEAKAAKATQPAKKA